MSERLPPMRSDKEIRKVRDQIRKTLHASTCDCGNCKADDGTSLVLDKMLTWVLCEDAGVIDEMLEALAEEAGKIC
jgi:hypothetical protein